MDGRDKNLEFKDPILCPSDRGGTIAGFVEVAGCGVAIG